jgi:maltose O-acetyltransferase
MRSEKQKMLAGDHYLGNDAELVQDRMVAKKRYQQFNQLAYDAPMSARTALLSELFQQPTDADITAPFHCDYGYNIKLGSKVYFNFNCVVLDVATVTIGDQTLFGPNVQLYTALHPMDAATRSTGLESGKPITIGKQVWVGGGAIICPGVNIGDGAVIGAGSVVTRDIPANVFAAGNPCRVIKSLD